MPSLCRNVGLGRTWTFFLICKIDCWTIKKILPRQLAADCWVQAGALLPSLTDWRQLLMLPSARAPYLDSQQGCHVHPRSEQPPPRQQTLLPSQLVVLLLHMLRVVDPGKHSSLSVRCWEFWATVYVAYHSRVWKALPIHRCSTSQDLIPIV